MKLYLTSIRPHLEYTPPVWNFFHKREIEDNENVQKFAIEMCLKSWQEFQHLAIGALKRECVISPKSSINKHTFLTLLSFPESTHTIPEQ